MKQRSDIDRVLQVWMADGPTAIPDRVVDVVAARIGVQRQRRAWPFQRRVPMNPLFKLGAAAAAVLVIAVVGYSLLPGQAGPGGPSTPLPTASPSAAPTLTPSATPDATAKTTTWRPFNSAPDLTITFAPPAGWGEFEEFAVIGPADSTDPAGVSVVFLQADGIHSDPCRWDIAGTGGEGQPGDLAVGVDALELATALDANTAYRSAGAPTPVSLGSNAGYAVELQLPADLDFATCDVPNGDANGEYIVFGGGEGGIFPQGPGNRWRVSVVDVGDVQVIVVLSSFSGTSAADMAAARSIVDSIRFTP